MKLYISADMEGTAAVSSWTQCDPTNTTEYPYYRRLMSQEVRAAIDGAWDAGVTNVLVNDSHSSMRNVLWDELPAHARMIYGNRKPLSMMEGLDSGVAAAFFTGYHAAVGQADGVLDHTYTPEVIYEVRINGTRCSEATMNAAVAGLHNVPVVLITGDRATIEDARRQMPWITGVVVKESIGRYCVDSISPQAARQAVRDGAQAAIQTLDRAKPFVFEAPITLEIDFAGTQHADVVELMPGFERRGGRGARFIHHDYRTVFRAFVAAFRLAGAANASV